MLTVDQIPAILETNLQEMFNITGIPVLYGTETEAYAQGPAKIIVGLAETFTFLPGSGGHHPGPADLGDGTAARILYICEQDFRVWVRGAPPANSVPAGQRAVAAQQSTAALRHAVAAALWKAGNGGEGTEGQVTVVSGTWHDPKTQDFQYGAVVILNCKVRIPVLDQAYAKLQLDINNVTTTTYHLEADGVTQTLAVQVGPAPAP